MVEFCFKRSKKGSGDFSCIFRRSQILLKAGCREGTESCDGTLIGDAVLSRQMCCHSGKSLHNAPFQKGKPTGMGMLTVFPTFPLS